MRPMLAVLVAAGFSLLTPADAWAQGPPPAPLDPNDPTDRLLRRWEQANRTARFWSAKCSRKDTDRATGVTRVWEGSAAYVAPGSYRLYLACKAEKTWEYFLLTPGELVEFRSAESAVYVRQRPFPEWLQRLLQCHFASLILNMRAAEAKSRYAFRLVREDDHYHYLTVQPLRPADRHFFREARVVLFKGSLLLRQVWIQSPNGSEVLWELPVVDPSTPVKPSDFNRPPTPRGWKEILISQPRLGA